MEHADELRVERDLLELRLVLLAQVIEERPQLEQALPEMVERMEELFARLRLVNELLAKMRRVMP